MAIGQLSDCRFALLAIAPIVSVWLRDLSLFIDY
jgi:hypothetical protein